jgi:hypothetical protein
MSYLLPHLRNGWAVDQAILSEEDRVVVIRFGSDADDTCMRMDEVRARRNARDSTDSRASIPTTDDDDFAHSRDADVGGGGG